MARNFVVLLIDVVDLRVMFSSLPMVIAVSVALSSMPVLLKVSMVQPEILSPLIASLGMVSVSTLV